MDGFHGGEVTSLRMIRHMVADGESALADMVDNDFLTWAIEYYEGNTLVVVDSSRYRHKEVDYLGLGCERMSVATRF